MMDGHDRSTVTVGSVTVGMVTGGQSRVCTTVTGGTVAVVQPSSRVGGTVAVVQPSSRVGGTVAVVQPGKFVCTLTGHPRRVCGGAAACGAAAAVWVTVAVTVIVQLIEAGVTG